MNVSVVYWSGTGNTQAMSEAVARGIEAAGKHARLMEVSAADAFEIASEQEMCIRDRGRHVCQGKSGTD